MSLKSRLGRASLHLVEAAGELTPWNDTVQAMKLSRAMTGYQLTMALGAAYELGIIGYLKSQRTPAEVASFAGMTEPAAEVLLNALEEAGTIQRENGHIVLTTAARAHLCREGWNPGRGMIDFMLGTWSYWRDLGTALQKNEGHPVVRVYNPDNPLMAEFVRLTTSMLAAPSKALVQKLDLSNVRRMICGTVGVSFAAAVTQAKPDVEITVSCLPLLIRELPAAASQFNLKKPAEIIENTGDAEKDTWGASESYDLVFLARKFGYCGPEHGIQYLQKSREVIPPGGYLILWEPFADNFELAPWMKTAYELSDAMLGEPRPLYRKQDVVDFVREAGFPEVSTIDVSRGSVSFVVARR